MADPIDSLKQVLYGLASRYGICNLELSTYGTAGLQLQDGTELNFEYVKATEKLFVYAVLATLPEAPADRLAFCEHMLEMNCLEQDTVCATLALDRTRNAIIVQVGLAAADITLDRLDHTLHQLLDQRLRILAPMEKSDLPEKQVSFTRRFFSSLNINRS